MAIWDADATLTATAYIPVAQEQQFLSLPTYKFAYDQDKTLVKFYRADSNGSGSLGAWVDYQISASNIALLNGWTYRTPNDNAYESWYYFFIFPELRDIDYAYLGAGQGGGVGGNQTWRFWWSDDTTDGWDGTWTQVGVTTTQLYSVGYETKREQCLANNLNLTGVRGVRLQIDHTLALLGSDGGTPHLVHFFGSRSNGSRLAFWHPTEDHEVSGTWFDMGMIYGVKTQTFRVKNLSADKRANDVFLTTVAGGGSTNATSYHSFSIDGGGYESTLDIGTLETEDISEIITLKTDIPVGVNINFWSSIVARPTTWYQWYQSTGAVLTAEALAEAPERYNDVNFEADLVAGMKISNSDLYRNSGTYRAGEPYRPTGITMGWAGQADLIAGLGGDSYFDEYKDEFGFDGLYAEAYNTGKYANASASAEVVGDNYDDEYVDGYGNTGLYAIAEVRDPKYADATLTVTASLYSSFDADNIYGADVLMLFGAGDGIYLDFSQISPLLTMGI